MPLEEKRVDVTKSALILGGGVSGLSAALFISKMGMQVYLVEKEADLGGRVRTLKDFWPARLDGAEVVQRMADELAARENVEIFTSTAVTTTSRAPSATIRQPCRHQRASGRSLRAA